MSASTEPLIISTLTEEEIAAEIAAGLETAATAVGVSNPTLALNLSSINDWSVALPFLDLVPSMREWFGHLPGRWGGMTNAQLQAAGLIDENGWPTAIPDELDSIGTIWAWTPDMTEHPEDFIGRYVLTYEGEGDIRLNLDARVISEEPGRIVFENRNGGNINLRLFDTDPEGTGDYIRNISIVAEKNLALYEAGAIFNPDWLALIEDARVIRFMDWGNTNNATIVSWEDRNKPGDAGSSNGVPVEYMVALANQIGADPWFAMPHTADENYVRQFAIYVRDNLDPTLTARMEYSNEAWNWSFQQAQWLLQQSQSEWGVSASHDYYTKMAVRNALIWNEVFGEEAEDRLVNVLGVQTSNSWLTNLMLTAPTWKANEPDAWIDPATIFDEIAVTNYFGGSEVSDATSRAALVAAIKDPGVDTFAWLYDRLTDPDHAGSIYHSLDRMRLQAEVAERFGLDMVGYEGGQHVHHSFSISGLSSADLEVLTEFLAAFVRSEQMAALYQEVWDAWAGFSDGPFMQFGEASQPGRYGSWGLYSGLQDTNPRAELLKELNETATPWWDAEGGIQYQQGVTRFAGDAGEILVGTAKQDFLIGGAGDDIFIPGAGDDGINGGDGTDRVVLSGAIASYQIVAEGAGYRLTGPEGSKFLVNVENLTFDDMALISVTDMLAQDFPAPPMLEAPEPEMPDWDGPLPVGVLGTFIEAAPQGVAVEGNGVLIGGINRTSLIGREMGLGANDLPSYMIRVDGVHVEIDGQWVEPSYWSLQDNRAVQGGPALTGSALETALLFGSVVARAGEIHGTAGDDKFQGHAGDDVFHGGSGNDLIFGGDGNDTLYGGEGDDRIWGGSGDDVIFGGDGNDVLYGETGNDTLVPGAGNDRIYGGAGFDRLLLEGDPGDYLLQEEGEGYRLSGNQGSKLAVGIDEFAFYTPGEAADGAPGGFDVHSVLSLEEMLDLNAPPETALTISMRGQLIDSTPGGVAVEDFPDISGGAVISGINASSGIGRELGLSARDAHGSYIIYAPGAGIETEDGIVAPNYWSLQENRAAQNGPLLNGSPLETALLVGSVATHAGAVHGTAGDDRFSGHLRDDVFYGGAGNDVLYGGGGNDSLYGGDGDDRIWGGDGDDVIEGGRGNDVLYGDSGNDTFRFAAGDGNDRIADFSPGDRLDLSGYLLQGQSLSHHEDASGRLVITNGSDSITFSGLSLNDLAWIDGIS